MHNVIILEHNLLLAADFVGILEEAGHRIAGVAYDVQDALDIAASEHVDLVLIDIDRLGAGASLEAARELADRRHVSAVFVGSDIGWEFMFDSRYYRPTGFVRKPYAPEDIVEVFGRKAASMVEVAPEPNTERSSALPDGEKRGGALG